MLKRKREEPVIDSEKLVASVNSYLGIMRHSRLYSLRRKIVHRNFWMFSYGRLRNDYLRFKKSDSIEKEVNIIPDYF